MVPNGPGSLLMLLIQLAKNISAAAGVGLGDGTGVGEGTGLGDGMGVGVGVGCILLETEPHPPRNNKNPVKRIKATVRTKTSLEFRLSFKKGNYCYLGERLQRAGCPGNPILIRCSKGNQTNDLAAEH